jgi:hypothetical protein
MKSCFVVFGIALVLSACSVGGNYTACDEPEFTNDLYSAGSKVSEKCSSIIFTVNCSGTTIESCQSFNQDSEQSSLMNSDIQEGISCEENNISELLAACNFPY